MHMSVLNTTPNKCAEFIREKIGNLKIDLAIILGSGLGDLPDHLNIKHIFKYSDLPGFPVGTVSGHKGEFVIAEYKGTYIACMRGRVHLYEGIDQRVVLFPIRVFKELGCSHILISCAAGSLNPSAGPGSLVIIKDHINFSGKNPLVGPNDDEYGPRFFSLVNAYDKDLRNLLKSSAKENNISIHEGVYAWILGPTYETPAEIKMLSILGVDITGMSTVPEVIAARHCGLKVCAVAAVSNLAEGISETPATHEEVLEVTNKLSGTFIKLIQSFIYNLKEKNNGS